MKTPPIAINREISRVRIGASLGAAPSARKLRRRQRGVAPILGATLLTLAVLAWSIGRPPLPAFLEKAGNFLWGVKSSIVELALAVIAARLPKRH